jgi:hypothetical protein
MNFPLLTDRAQFQAVASVPQRSSQCKGGSATNQMNNLGLIWLLLVIGLLCLRHWSKTQHKQQAAACRCQQIETLEKIWKLTAPKDS